MLSFKPAFSLSPFTFIKSFPSFFLLSAIRVVSPACGDGGGLVAKPCLTLYDPMDCSLPGPPVHGILQARILEWVAISFFRGSSQLRNWTQISCITGRVFTYWAMREALSEVIDISPSNLDSSLCFIQAGISYSAYKLNKQGDNIQPWGTSFPMWNQSVVPCLVLIAASWPAHRILRR